jgi:hypothetical protein
MACFEAADARICMPLPMTGRKRADSPEPNPTQIDSPDGAATAGQGQGGQAGRPAEIARIDRAGDGTSADGDQADQQVVDRAARAATGGQGGTTTGSAPTSGQNKASNSPAAAGQTKKFYQSGVDAARKVESVQGRQYVLWAKGVRQLDAVNEWFHKVGFQPARSRFFTKPAATNNDVVFAEALEELNDKLKNLSHNA